MSNCLIREFGAQLSTTMDSVLRNAMFEIMKIFENSLHNHQMELSHKGEEIVQLKIKLQRAELRLREIEITDDRAEEKKKAQMNELQKEPEDAPKASEKTTDFPEIDFEVPDDWCAPLGCETLIKEEENVCPSVRLRRLYIPLWPISFKEEVNNCNDDSHQQTKRGRRFRRGSSQKETHIDIQDRSLPVRNQGTRRLPIRNDMKKLLQVIKPEYNIDLGGRPIRLKRGRKNQKGKVPENTLENTKEGCEVAVTESKSTGQETVPIEGDKKYTCKICKKVFDTPFGQTVHKRSHKRCRGCKKEFPSPSSLRCHKQHCVKLKKLLAKKAQSTDPPKPLFHVTEAPTKNNVIIKKENTPSSSNQSKSSRRKKDRIAKMHGCVRCGKRFHSRCMLEDHMRVHVVVKPFHCSMCPKKYHIAQSLKRHMMNWHKGQVNSSKTNEDLGWTHPLEEIDDNQEVLTSVSKDASPAINHNKVGREGITDSKSNEIWHTMGTQCSSGFICLLCNKLSSNKYLLIEHYRTHTGEKPLKCNHCPATFHSSIGLSRHRKLCGKPMIRCMSCGKKFKTKTRYERHVNQYHKQCSNVCKVCGKGFILEGCLKNHMLRHK